MKRWAFLVVVVLAAGASRFAFVDSKAKWVDEYYSVRRAEGRFDTGVNPNPFPEGVGVVVPKVPVEQRARGGLIDVLEEPLTVHPPLYFLLLRGWMGLFGTGLLALRSLTALISALAVAAAAACAWLAAGRRAAAATAVLMILAPLELDMGQQIKGYALLGLLAMASTALAMWLARGDDGGPRRRFAVWCVYAVVAALAVWTHYLGLLVVAAHALAWLTTGRSPALRPPAAAAATYLALLLPLVWFVRAPIAARLKDQVSGMIWLVPDAAAQRGFLEKRAHVPSALPELFFQTTGIRSILAAALVMLVVVLVLRRKDARSRLVATLALAGPIAVTLFDLVTGGDAMSMAGGRYSMISSAALWTTVGIGLGRPRWIWGALAVAAIAWVQVPAVRAYYRSPARPGYVDYGALARRMSELGCDRGDLVIWGAGGGAVLLELNTALPGRPSELLLEAPDARIDWLALEKPWQTVWVLAQPGTMSPLLDLLDARFARLPFEATAGVEVRRYRWRPDVADEPLLANRLLAAAIQHRLKHLWWQSAGAVMRVAPAVRSGRIVLEARYELEAQATGRLTVFTDSVRVATFSAEGRDLSGQAALTGRVHHRPSGGERLAITAIDGHRNEARLLLEPRYLSPNGRFIAPFADFTATTFDWTDCLAFGIEVIGAERAAGTFVVEELAVP